MTAGLLKVLTWDCASSVALAVLAVLAVLAALAEVVGAGLVWQGVREHRGLLWLGAGVLAVGLYGFVATLHRRHTSAGSWLPGVVSSSPGRCCRAS